MRSLNREQTDYIKNWLKYRTCYHESVNAFEMIGTSVTQGSSVLIKYKDVSCIESIENGLVVFDLSLNNCDSIELPFNQITIPNSTENRDGAGHIASIVARAGLWATRLFIVSTVYRSMSASFV